MASETTEFRQFLTEAKRNAYASGTGIAVRTTEDGTKEIAYEREAYRYKDCYTGELDFIGEEKVWHQGRPVWGMNYYGFTHEPIEGFPGFLLDCLKQVPVEAPYRGPATVSSDRFVYSCSWDGDEQWFRGEESIRYEGRVIFSLAFHGGRIRFE
ncbi:DUF5680 domain-containing protein [Paenibacillus aurantiacus]|uniref:DUF5680 domain-containing protein n=1 Tax=Paenibacillus aurantiacus TaxID=1936118 RepID=A0ABV5KTB4_9BACL